MKNLPKLFCLLLMTVFGGRAAADPFYQPDRVNYGTPADQGLRYESVTFKSADGTTLHGWFVPATVPAIATVIYFHGNAQNMSAHFSFVSWLPRQGFNVFAFDYRGYGQSEGTPSRTGVHEDGIAALRYIKTRTGINQDRLFVLGQSPGGAVAISTLGAGPISGIRGVVVESTFDSYRAMAKEKVPGLLTAQLLAEVVVGDELSPLSVVAKLAPTPLLVIHGSSDGVVPYARGKSLFDRAKEPKSMWTIEGGRHTEAFKTYGTTYQPRLVSFFNMLSASLTETFPLRWVM